MAFLDWMKNRGAAKQQHVAPEPQQEETAKQKGTREHREWKANLPPVAQMPSGLLKEALSWGDRAIKLEQSAHETTRVVTPETAEGATSPQPMRQNMIGQDNHAPALSPTNGQKGHPEPHKGAPASERPARETPKPAPRPPHPTLPRRPGSWER